MDQEIALSRNLKKSDGSIITFSILIIGLVAVIFLLSSEFPSAAGFRNSLADVQPVQDSIARSDQNVIPPRSFTRGISEVIQLSSVSGVPGQTNHYTRAIAENIGVTSSPSGPSAAGAQTEVGSVSRNEYSGFSSASNKRAEEKIGVLLK